MTDSGRPEMEQSLLSTNRRQASPSVSRHCEPVCRAKLFKSPTPVTSSSRSILTLRRLLTHSTPAVLNCCCVKGPAPYWSNPSFLIFDIRALSPILSCIFGTADGPGTVRHPIRPRHIWYKSKIPAFRIIIALSPPSDKDYSK